LQTGGGIFQTARLRKTELCLLFFYVKTNEAQEVRRIIDDGFRLAKITARGTSVGRFLVFSSVGMVGTAAHYLVLVVLHEILGVHPVMASAVGSIVGAFVNYLLNYHVTFESNASHGSAILKFYLIATIGFLLNIVIMWLMLDHFGMHYIVSQLIATSTVLVWGYSANSLWTFRDTKERKTRT